MTHTLAELKAAQAAGKKIKVLMWGGQWEWSVAPLVFYIPLDNYRIVEEAPKLVSPEQLPLRVPHKHATTIKAWADGALIEFKTDEFDGWRDLAHNPCWNAETEYRVKPEKKPDTVRYAKASCADDTPMSMSTALSRTYWSCVKSGQDNIKATFDGETGVLKSVEMV